MIQPIIDVMDTEIIIVRYMDDGFMVIRFNKNNILRQNNEGTVFVSIEILMIELLYKARASFIFLKIRCLSNGFDK